KCVKRAGIRILHAVDVDDDGRAATLDHHDQQCELYSNKRRGSVGAAYARPLSRRTQRRRQFFHRDADGHACGYRNVSIHCRQSKDVKREPIMVRVIVALMLCCLMATATSQELRARPSKPARTLSATSQVVGQSVVADACRPAAWKNVSPEKVVQAMD